MEPKTSEEMLLNGEDIAPRTREEIYIKRLYDKSIPIPIVDGKEWLTTKEYFLLQAAEKTIPSEDFIIKQLTATENKTYSEDKVYYSPVVVNVPIPTMLKLDVTENGDYIAPTGSAYNEVDVKVPLGSKTITQNGEYSASDDNLAGYDTVNVNVPLPANAYLQKTVSNLPQPIASFTDGSDNVLTDLVVDIAPVQSGSGEPSPTNVRPITGWSGATISSNGKNFFNTNRFIQRSGYSNLSFTESENTITITGRTSGGRFACFNILQAVGQTYTISFSSITNFTGIKFKESDTEPTDWITGDGTAISGITKRYTYTATMPWVQIGCELSGDPATITDLQLELGSDATTWTAYNGHTYTIPFTDSQGQSVEVFGGVLAVTSGVLTATYGYVDLGDYTYILSNGIFLSTYNFNAKSRGCDGACTIYTNSGDVTLSDMPNYSFQLMTGTYGIAIRNDDYNDATAFKTAMQGVKLVYELATPITIQLTPTAVKSLAGSNNIFADSGDVEECGYWSKTE